MAKGECGSRTDLHELVHQNARDSNEQSMLEMQLLL